MSEWRRGEHVVSTDPARLDLDVVHGFLVTAYWAEGIERAVLERSVAGSLCFGVYDSAGQVGFARVVSDGARFAWLGDVFVLPRGRGQGLGVWLVETVLDHPDLAGVRWLLATADAHGLYHRFGFVESAAGRFMERPAARSAPQR